MSIYNRQVLIDDGDVAFCIDLKDAEAAFEVIGNIPFSAAYDDDSVLIYPARDKYGSQQDVRQIKDALNAD